MSTHSVTAIILAAGRGTRMKSGRPKVMHPLAGRPMIAHLMATLESAGIDRICVVTGPDSPEVAAAVHPHKTAIQAEALGTGHAALAAREALCDMTGDVAGDVLLLFGADPLITPETIRSMIERRRAADKPAVVVSGFRPRDPAGYGRLIQAQTQHQNGTLDAIVEHRDATPEQLAVTLCNAGTMAVDGRRLWPLLERVTNDNARGEYYLTDIVAIARAEGRNCAVVEGDASELIGIDSRADLAEAEALVQAALRQKALDGGATLTAPDTVWFSHDTAIGRDVMIEPNVFFGPGVTIHDNVHIRAGSHLEGCEVFGGAVIGPYARLRPGAIIGEDARIGNFVEVKNATLGKGASAAHLTYIGDASVGPETNIGAGTITANYDGFNKHRTTIGAGVSVGSNVVLVAPVNIGDGASIGAGSTITKDVEPDALALTRAAARVVSGWAARFRDRHRNNKS